MRPGFFGVGVYHPKYEINVGGLWRSAFTYGAAFVATVGQRYKYQASDTPKTTKQVPLMHYSDMQDLIDHLPDGCQIVGVELDASAKPLTGFSHPRSALYLLGAEDHGLTKAALSRCHDLIYIPTPKPQSLNVATAGSLVCADRYIKALK